MNWQHLLSYFFGGMFLANAVPHFVSGGMGKRFQTPFAKPPGKGLSTSTVNVLWGFANFVFAYLLLLRVGHFDPRSDDPRRRPGGGDARAVVLDSGRYHAAAPNERGDRQLGRASLQAADGHARPLEQEHRYAAAAR